MSGTQEHGDDGDIRQYVKEIATEWKLIAILTLAGAVAIGTYSAIRHPVYEAVAILAVAQTRTIALLEGISASEPIPLKSFPDLALSDTVLSSVLRTSDSPPETLVHFRQRLKATSAADPTVQRLIVHDSEPARAADTANKWAKTVMVMVQAMYGRRSPGFAVYEAQLTASRKALDEAEMALESVQILNRSRRSITLAKEAKNLRTRLHKLRPDAVPTFADDFVVLMLSAEVFTGDTTGAPVPRISFQVADGQSLYKTVADQIAAVDDILAAIPSLDHRAIIDDGAASSSLQIGLTRARDFAQTQYLANLSLVPKVEQAKIAAEENADIVHLISPAAEPPAGNGSPFTVVLDAGLGGAVMMICGVILVGIRQWWRRGQIAT